MSDRLTTFEREVLACLPVEIRHGAATGDIGDDVWAAPLFGWNPPSGYSRAGRRTLVVAAIRRIEKILRRERPGNHVLIYLTEIAKSAKPKGPRLGYCLTRDGAAVARRLVESA